MANVEKGLLEVQRMSCAGMTLSCQLKVHSCLWTATEVSTQHAGLSPRRAAPQNAGNLDSQRPRPTPVRPRAPPAAWDPAAASPHGQLGPPVLHW